MLNHLPSLSIIVPSYNQAAYLEETLLSVIEQQYPGLELIVIDGGSTDGSVEIIRRYEEKISYWVSEPDRGQSHAINKGLLKANCEWVGWLNSDDCFLPSALSNVFSEVDASRYDLIYGYCKVGSTIEEAIDKKVEQGTRDNIYQILHFFYSSKHIIPSNAAFVRRSILNKVGGVREDLNYCMDLDWFVRIMSATERIKHLPNMAIGFYRLHEATKTFNSGGKMQIEAISIAEESLHLLSYSQATQLKQKIDYRKMLNSWIADHGNFLRLIQIGLSYPYLATSDSKFKICLKGVLFRK